MIRHVYRWWLYPFMLLAVIAHFALPPRWFLQPVEMIYDHRAETLTLVRKVSAPPGVPVYALWWDEIITIDPLDDGSSQTCTAPGSGRTLSHYQKRQSLPGGRRALARAETWPAPWVADCLRESPVVLNSRWSLRLWGWFPLWREVQMTTTIQPDPGGPR